MIFRDINRLFIQTIEKVCHGFNELRKIEEGLTVQEDQNAYDKAKLDSTIDSVARPVTGLGSSRSSRSTTEYAHILANSDSSRSKTFTGSVREATGFDPSPVLPQSTRKVKKLTLKPGVAFSNGGNGSDGLTKLASKLSEIKLKPGVALSTPVRVQTGSHQARRQRIDKRSIRHENQQLADDEEMSGEERLSRLV